MTAEDEQLVPVAWRGKWARDDDWALYHSPRLVKTDDVEDYIQERLYDEATVRALSAQVEELRAALKPDLAEIERIARKVNPGRTEDHIKSVALDALTIFRHLAALQPKAGQGEP